MAKNDKKLTREEKKQAKIEESIRKWGNELFKAIEAIDYQNIDKILKKHPEALNYTPPFQRIKVGYSTYHQIGRDDYAEEWHDQGSYDIYNSALLEAVGLGNEQMVNHLLSLEKDGEKLKLDSRSLAHILLKTKDESIDTAILKTLYEKGYVDDEAAAQRAINIMGDRWYSKGLPIEMLLNQSKFKLTANVSNEFLRQAFKYNMASKVLSRSDLQLQPEKTVDILTIAVEKGSADEISRLLDRFDFVYPRKEEFKPTQYQKERDHGELLDKLFKRIKKGEELVDVALKILNKKETELGVRGFELLTASMDIADNRIFKALTKRADVVYSVAKNGDNGILKSLLSKQNLNITYHEGDILMEALINKINAENIALLLDNKTLSYDNESLERGLNGAAHQKRYDVVKLVLDRISKEIPNVADGSLLVKCLENGINDENRELINTILNRREFSFERIQSEIEMRKNNSYMYRKEENAIEDILSFSVQDEEVFRTIVSRNDLDLRKFGYLVLDRAITAGFEEFIGELFEREDLRIGENVGALVKRAKEQLPDSNLSELIFNRRQQELEIGQDAITKTFEDVDNEESLDKIDD